MATATTTRKATKPKAAKTKATPRGSRKAGGEDMTPVPGDPGPIPAADGVVGEGGAATAAGAPDRGELPATTGERRRLEYECIWKAHRVRPGRAEAIRVMRERLTRMFEGMDDFISCGVYLDGEDGAEFRLRMGEDHGLRILLDADPDC